MYIISRLGSIRGGLLQQIWKAREEEAASCARILQSFLSKNTYGQRVDLLTRVTWDKIGYLGPVPSRGVPSHSQALSHSDSQRLPVTRRSPSHAPRPTFTQDDLPRPESLAAARVNRRGPPSLAASESFSITESPRLESHAVDRVIRPGPRPESLAAAHCLTVTLAPRLESESFAQPV